MADQQNQVLHSDEGQHENAQRRERVVLSPEELRVLRECNRESFWYRCVPLGIVFIGSTQILVNKGFLSPNPRFGALFKNMGAALAAFLLGKMSYQGRCREKILSLENSALAESMRKGKRGVELMRDISLMPGMEGGAADEFEPKSRSVKSDFGTEGNTVEAKGLDDSHRPSMDQRKSRSLKSDFGTEGNTVEAKGLDESHRPSMDRETSLYQRSDDHSAEKPGLSYEELRNRNRLEYEKANSPKSGASRAPADSSSYQRAPQPSEPSSGSTLSWETESSSGRKGARKNKYGDVVD